MSRREMGERLGLPVSASGRMVVNAAIREWMPGGDHLLDAMHHAEQLRIRLGGREWTDLRADAGEAVGALNRVRDRMKEEVIRRFEEGEIPC